MYSYGFNTNSNSFYYPLEQQQAYNCDYTDNTNNSNNNNPISPFYTQDNYNYYNNYYNQNFNIDLEMSNLIHKFAEKVGATDEDTEQQQQGQQGQHQQRYAQQQQGQGQGQQRTAGSARNKIEKHQPRVMQSGEGRDLDRDQYDLGRTSGGMGGGRRGKDEDMDTDMDSQGMGGNRSGGMGMGGGSGMGMGGGGSGMGQQQQHFRSEMGTEQDTDTAGRGFKHDWKTSESMSQGGRNQGRRNL